MRKNQLNFVIIDKSSSKILGLQTLCNIEPSHGISELGLILWNHLDLDNPSIYEAIYLSTQYVFEDLCYRRLEWKCDNKDEFSKSLASRFGFNQEEVLRQHMVIRGDNIDTIIFALLEGNWPKSKKGIEKWLNEENFEDGQAKQNLDEV